MQHLSSRLAGQGVQSTRDLDEIKRMLHQQVIDRLDLSQAAMLTKEQLGDNLAVALDEIIRLKPSSSKGKYLIKAAVATTFGPDILLDTNVTKVEF